MGFPTPFGAEGWANMGAEFVHGRLPETFELCKRFDLSLEEQTGVGVNISHGMAQSAMTGQSGQERGFWNVLEAMAQAADSQSVTDFLDERASDFSEDALSSTKSYVESYAAAETTTASAKAQGLEYLGGQDVQFRIKGGYEGLIQKLREAIEARGGTIELNAPIVRIHYSLNRDQDPVKLQTVDGEVVAGDKCLLTIPSSQYKTIEFAPSLPEKVLASEQIGFGSVVKAVLRFSHRFWLDPMHRVPPETSFLFLNGHPFPVFWTAEPSPEPTLTGWLAGPSSLQHRGRSDAAMTDLALASIGGAFRRSMGELRRVCIHSVVTQWAEVPYIQGAYSYRIAGQLDASARLASPVNDQLFFAGEATHFGSEIGTVEAAFVSALRAVDEMLAPEA